MKGKGLLPSALGLAATAAWAAVNSVYVTGITSNSSTDWVQLDPGLYVVEIYAPDAGVAADPCGAAGGDWDTSAATMTYSPDFGVTETDVAVAELVGATADVLANLQVGKGYRFRLTVSSVGASTCLNYKVGLSER